MNPAWTPPPPRPPEPMRPLGLLLVVLRLPVLAVIIFGGLALLMLLRLLEKPLFGAVRPFTPYVTQTVCQLTLKIMGFRVHQHGQIMTHKGALVANHTSWLDIFALNSRKTLYFVSKSEVADWPGIGWLARATGTLFIRRDRKEARAHTEMFENRLLQGHRLLFFPEGTSTDGCRVLPFKTTLFAAFFSERLQHEMYLQSISVVYHPPAGKAPAFYGWWGEMAFTPSFLEVLSQPRQGMIEMTFHQPVRADAFPNRKSLASHLETETRLAHQSTQT